MQMRGLRNIRRWLRAVGKSRSLAEDLLSGFARGSKGRLSIQFPVAETPETLNDTTVFVTTVGDEANFADCMQHLRAQFGIAAIEIIDHVAPLSVAFQEMHVRCTTEFYVQVDEDMILFPDAIQRLRKSIETAPRNVALVCAPLWDCDAQCLIYGVKIYRWSIVKQFPYINNASCEIEQLGRLRAAGYEAIVQPLDSSYCLGEHGKHYTPRTIFQRWQRCFQKHRLFGRMDWIEPYAQTLLARYVETGEVLHLYAFLGAVAGIADSSLIDSEQNWRDPNEAFQRLQYYFRTQARESRP
jgi:hypothetical protein